MAKERTGSLKFEGGVWKGRVTVTKPDGSTSRPWYSLDTADEILAARKLRDLNKRVSGPGSAGQKFGPYAWEWWQRRKDRGVAQTASEEGLLKNYILPAPGEDKPALQDMFLVDVRPIHILSVLEAVIAQGRLRGTVVHARNVMHGIMARAYQAELVSENVVDRVPIPEMSTVVAKERPILTDDKVATLYLAPEVTDIEIKLLVVVARVEGGMRTRDLTAWDWTMLDLVGFAWCMIPRTKTKRPQKMEIPVSLHPPLRRWWEDHGSPSAGPVFPIVKGRRKGEARKVRGVSFADRLRRALLKAGITREELHTETAWSLPVDFHSCRRALATALDDAGIPRRIAMKLTGHASEQAHERYIMDRNRIRPIPEAAIPRLSWPQRPGGPEEVFQPGPALRPPHPRMGIGIVLESSGALGLDPNSLMIPERDTRFELATLSLGS